MTQLILEVMSRQAGTLGSNRRKVVGPQGARLGSRSDNDWVLPGDYVSRHHATVRYLNDMFLIENHGTNLTAINDRSRAMQRNDQQILRDGDVLFIDEYEISVRVVADAASIAPLDTPERRGSEEAFDIPLGTYREPPTAGDVLDLLPDSRRQPPPAPPRPPPADPLLGRALPDRPPPSPAKDDPGSRKVDPKWFETVYPDPKPRTGGKDTPALPPPAPPPSLSPPESGDTSAATLDALLRGVGLDPQRQGFDAAVVQELGEVLRIVVAGTMDLLKARAEIKSQFRLPGTQIAQSHNNPLKFSADVDDALQRLLIQRSPAYLGTPDAFDDAFDDIRLHQLAVLTAMQAGFEHVLGAFDPERLDEALGPDGGLGVLTNRKAKLWDRHVAMYSAVMKDPDDAFRHLFGDAFGRAYEQQLQRLKTERRAARRHRSDSR